MLPTRVIRQVRARQEAAAEDDLVELVTDTVVEMFPELLMGALEQPEVRAALLSIVLAARRGVRPSPPPAARRSAARGVRRV